MTFENFTLIGAPTDCAGRPGGLDRSPTVLRDLGVAEAIGASTDLNDLPIRIDAPERDPISGVTGAASVERAIRRTRRCRAHPERRKQALPPWRLLHLCHWRHGGGAMAQGAIGCTSIGTCSIPRNFLRWII